MKNEITIDGVVYVKKEKTTNLHIIPTKKLEWGKVCNKELKWVDAIDWCFEQGDGFRLPTQIELLQAYENKVTGFRNSNFWASTEPSESYARYVFFTDGSTYGSPKTDNCSVRCVREVV